MPTAKTLRALALSFPGAEEGTSYGTPAYRVSRKLFARLREEGNVAVIRCDFEQRDALLESDPRR